MGLTFALALVLAGNAYAGGKAVFENPGHGPDKPTSTKQTFFKKLQHKVRHVVDAARIGIETRSPTVALHELRSNAGVRTKDGTVKAGDPSASAGKTDSNASAGPGWRPSDFASKTFKVFHPNYLSAKLRSPPSVEASQQATRAIGHITDRWSAPESSEETIGNDPANVTRQGREGREHKKAQLEALDSDAKRLAELARSHSSGHLIQLSNASEAIVGKYGRLSGETNTEEIKRKLGLDFVAADRQFVDALTARIKSASPSTNLEKLSPSEMRHTLELFLSHARNANEPTPPWIRTLVTKVLNTDHPNLKKMVLGDGPKK